MDDEGAFLAALTANPADDGCRLVFADWLEEREQFDKAKYLRLACQAVQAIGTPAEAGVTDQIIIASELLPWEWRNTAAGRFGLTLMGYAPEHKFHTIKAIRNLWGFELSLAKAESERLPNRLYDRATFELIARAIESLREVPSIRLNVEREQPTTPGCERLYDEANHRYELTGSFFGQRDTPSDLLTEILTKYVFQFATQDLTTSGVWQDRTFRFVLCENVPLAQVAMRLQPARMEGMRIAKEHHLFFQPLTHRLPTRHP